MVLPKISPFLKIEKRFYQNLFTYALRIDAFDSYFKGNEDFFFYKILNKLNSPVTPSLIKQVESDLLEFERNFPYSEKRKQLVTRSKFLFFDAQDGTKQNKSSLIKSEKAKTEFYSWLKTQLGLYFNHNPTKTQKASPSTYQSKLDPNIIDLSKLIEGTNYSTSYYKPEADELFLRYYASKLDDAKVNLKNLYTSLTFFFTVERIAVPSQ